MKNKINNIGLKTENLLSEFFRAREEEIYNFTDIERKLLSKKSKDYSKIYIAIENIPDVFVETITEIKTSIKNYIDTLNEIQGIENEKIINLTFQGDIKVL